MKYLLLALIATPAFAATNVACPNGSLDFTFKSEKSLGQSNSLVEITASGVQIHEYTARVDVVEANSPGKNLVANLVTLNGVGKEDLASIRARIEIPLGADGKTVGDKGILQITNFPSPRPRMLLNRYYLGGCTGEI